MLLSQVQWDEPSSIVRPERVSPWELEPLVATSPPSSQPTQRNKRARPSVLPSPSPDLSVLGMLFSCSNYSVINYHHTDCQLQTLVGVWKSQVESPSSFSYCDPQHGRELYPSPKFNSVSKANSLGFSGNSTMATVSSNSMYWSNRVETVTESFSPVINKDCGEKRQSTGNGCRLFGIQLLENSSFEDLPVVTASGTVGDIRPVPSLEAESDQHFEQSNVNRADHPSVSCDAEKSCLRSPQESQSRQIRSCTKVLFGFFLTQLCSIGCSFMGMIFYGYRPKLDIPSPFSASFS